MLVGLIDDDGIDQAAVVQSHSQRIARIAKGRHHIGGRTFHCTRTDQRAYGNPYSFEGPEPFSLIGHLQNWIYADERI